MDFGASTTTGWETHSMSFTAGTTTASLAFASPVTGALDYGVFVDNVRISAIPEPSALALVTGSFAFLAVAVRKAKRA
jgi:hypothetical protein